MDRIHPPTPARSHAVFLSDYDMQMTEHLVRVSMSGSIRRGAWEASGTSGMKVLVNGGLNSRSWTAGGPKPMRRRSAGPLATDRNTATTPAGTRPKPTRLYALLEHEIIPDFMTRERDGIPSAWVARCAKAWPA